MDMSAQNTEKHRRWLLPAPRPQVVQPGLYLTATPIGNLGDITLRALDVLGMADLIACEDTRVTGKLLAHYGIERPLLAYHDHSAPAQREKILRHLADGKIVVLVSDAGTPLIADPGYKLVRACLDAGHHVSSLPGANAPLTALQLSGLPSDQFCFLGFLPPKAQARRTFLAAWHAVQASLIVFETAPRLLSALKDIEAALGPREIAVMREATKMFEEVRRGGVAALIDFYAQAETPKGEIVIVIGPPAPQEHALADIEQRLRLALRTHSTKEAAALVAAATGQKRKTLYAMALRLEKP